jgi:hypothetical protein
MLYNFVFVWELVNAMKISTAENYEEESVGE